MPQPANTNQDRYNAEQTSRSSITPQGSAQPRQQVKRKPPAGKVGDRLRDARMAKGIRLSEIQQKTKISRTNLIAMEQSKYSELPATSFCRGFYKLYSQAVGLDAEAIIYQFEMERNRSPERNDYYSIEFGSQNEEVEEMAGRPSFLVFSSIGLILLILVFFAIFLCWFFSWNPAAFLSQKLRSLDPQPTFEETLVPKRPTASTQEMQEAINIAFSIPAKSETTPLT